MANVTIRQSLNMDALTPGNFFDDYTLFGASSTFYILRNAAFTNYVGFLGSGFVVNSSGVATAGNATTFEMGRNGSVWWDVVGTFFSLTSFYQHIANNDVASALALMLRGNDSIVGSDGADLLRGFAGDDYMIGLNGNDQLFGGPGNDYYFAQDENDSFTEYANEGVDTVETNVSWTLGDNFENLILTDFGGVNGTGNALNNTIEGNIVGNRLEGRGGNDILRGYGGNDVYVIDDVGDIASESSASDGIDLVQTPFSWRLGLYLENLTLTGVNAINGTGNGYSNIIRGNGAANVIDGRLGADRMIGGGGNDTYYVDNLLDVIVEPVGGGLDRVFSSVTHTLSARVETLTLTGANAINGAIRAPTASMAGSARI